MYEKFLIQSNRNMHPHCWAKYAQYLHAFAILMCTQNELEMFLCAFHLVCVRSSLSLALYATVNASELAINFTCSFVRLLKLLMCDSTWYDLRLDLTWFDLPEQKMLRMNDWMKVKNAKYENYLIMQVTLPTLPLSFNPPSLFHSFSWCV